MSNLPSIKIEKIANITAKAKICKDFYVGATKVLNSVYLPQYVGENDNAYLVRLNGTAFANMYAPIVDGLAGLTTKKEPTTEGFDGLDFKDVDMKHSSLLSFGKKMVTQSLIDGIVFGVAETSTEKNRIFVRLYTYDNLMSYVYEDNILKQIVFKDVIEKQDGLFGVKTEERYIVFKIGGGEVWYQKENDGGLKKQEEWTNSLTEIPIVSMVTGKELSKFEVIPKLYDTAILNKVHLNLESHISNVLSVVGNPIPVFYGQVEEGKVTIGVKDALRFEDKQKEGFEYAEITGAGVEKLQNKIKLVEEQIDKLTFSLLQKQDSKTVIDAQETQSKNSSFLTDVAVELEVKMNKLFRYVAELENKTITEDAKIEYKKDFDTAIVNIEIAKDLLTAGEMSRETFYSILQTGELPKDFDAKEEKSKIEADTGIGIEE